MRRIAPFVVAVSLCAIVALPAMAAKTVKTVVSQPSRIEVKATAEGCSNNPGPFITLNGELRLGGVSGRLIFRNNVKGTHTSTTDVNVDVVLIAKGDTIRFNKQPSRGGVGGNPYIYIQFFDHRWRALGDEAFLGRCVQGLNPTALNFGLETDSKAEIGAGSCDNSRGPFITLNGALVLGGVNAKLIFRNNPKGTHQREVPVEVDVEIIPAGQTIRFAKQPPQGGVGGNPLIYFQWIDGDGNALSQEFFLGRCNKIGP